jgi:hypothetical protein
MDGGQGDRLLSEYGDTDLGEALALGTFEE